MDPKSVTVARLAGALWVAILAVASLIPVAIIALTSTGVAWLSGVLLLAWGIAILVLGLLTFLWPAWRYRFLRWWMDDRGVYIRRGVLWREDIAIPKSRIQHTDVSQGPLERSFNLASLIVHTAGTVNASVTLAGLSHPLAMHLRDLLLEGGQDDGV